MRDWIRLLASLHIDYADAGGETTAGHVNIKCPWCGSSDKGKHLGIALDSGAYHCWRNETHSGYSALSLLKELTHLPSPKIGELIRKYGLQSHVYARPVRAATPAAEDLQSKYDNFHECDTDCLEYLKARGFDNPRSVVREYDLKYGGHVGYWKYRLLLPLKLGVLNGWTGRTIHGEMSVRYLTSTVEDGADVSRLLFCPEYAARWVVVCEGPLDALKLCVAGKPLGIRSVALLGKEVGKNKEAVVWEALGGASPVVMLDADVSLVEQYKLARSLEIQLRRTVPVWRLPSGAKDAGECSIATLREHLQWQSNGQGRTKNGL